MPDRHFLTASRASHAVYGSIIVLAVITGLDEASATPRESLVAIVGLAIAVALSQIYADGIGSTFRAARPLTREEWLEVSANVAFGFGAALVPAIFFVLAAVGVLLRGLVCGDEQPTASSHGVPGDVGEVRG